MKELNKREIPTPILNLKTLSSIGANILFMPLLIFTLRLRKTLGKNKNNTPPKKATIPDKIKNHIFTPTFFTVIS